MQLLATRQTGGKDKKKEEREKMGIDRAGKQKEYL